MNKKAFRVPFIDLKLQHQPLQSQLQQAMHNILEQGDFVLGEAVSKFEADFAKASGVEYGVGVGSGTDAIVLGLQACNISTGDEVIVPANTFVATLIGVLRTGARPVLVDCDSETGLIDLEAAAAAVTTRTKAIIPVHLYGQMVSPQQLLDFANTYNLLIFEDAAQAHLAQREGYYAGSVGIAAAFSFYPSKNLGALGDAGIVVTKDRNIAERIRRLRNYGAEQKYLHVESGTNSRLDTLQAAVLQQKLPYLQQWNRDRSQAAQMYDRHLKILASAGIAPLQNQSGMGHIYHLYVIKIEDYCSQRRPEIQEELTLAGIQTGIHYPIPCHLQPVFSSLGYQKGDFPQAEKLARQILSLPIYPGISHSQIQEVVAAMASSLAKIQNSPSLYSPSLATNLN
jgi:dTDP-4-amino-4,6-dideoxygalactose transaminase